MEPLLTPLDICERWKSGIRKCWRCPGSALLSGLGPVEENSRGKHEDKTVFRNCVRSNFRSSEPRLSVRNLH